MPNRLAPTLAALVADAGNAPALGGLRSTEPGEATGITAWVFYVKEGYGPGYAARFVDARPVATLADCVAAGDWAEMETNMADTEGSGRFFRPGYKLFMLPSWITSDLTAATWERATNGSCLGRVWLGPCPRLAEIVDFDTFVNVCNFLETKPRKAERIALKVALVAWLDGDRDFPREAAWMTRPYDRNAAAAAEGFRARRFA